MTPLSLAVIVIVSSVIRIWYLFTYIGLQGGGISDDDSYHSFALNLLEYGVYGSGTQPTAFVPPGMALALAGVYKLFGVSFAAWAGCIIALNVLICVLIWDIARRVFGARTALVAGLIASVYPQFLFRTIHTDAKTLMLVGLCAGAWCLVREWESGRRRWIVLAGACFGIAYLARTQLVLLPLFLPIWAYLRYRPDRPKIRSAAALILLGAVPTMMVWTARNYAQFGAVIPGMSGEGLALASVNNEANYDSGRLRGLVNVNTASSLFTTESGYVDGNGQFTRKFLNLSEVEQNRLLKSASLHWVLTNPHKMLVMVLFKWKAVWVSPQSYNWPLWSRILNFALYLGVVLPFAVVGVYYVLRVKPATSGAVVIWAVIALYTTLLHAMFEGEIRHRMAFEPGLIILAAAGLVYAAGRLQTRRVAG
jgi:4-amino-4-deoxy-L-arabinose transferase-like glycosyltransferase